MEKQAIRALARERLRRITPDDRAVYSRTVTQRIIDTLAQTGAGTVMLFASLADEPDLVEVDRWCRLNGRRRAYPICPPRGAPMEAVVSTDDLGRFARGPYGFRIPERAEPVEPGAIDIVVTPGLAFDPACRRVGRGKAYYDRFFACPECRARRVGAAFDCQVFERVPTSDHDVPLDMLITERRVLVRGGKG